MSHDIMFISACHVTSLYDIDCIPSGHMSRLVCCKQSKYKPINSYGQDKSYDIQFDFLLEKLAMTQHIEKSRPASQVRRVLAVL